MAKCDMNCQSCTLPVEKCKGGSYKTAFDDWHTRPTVKEHGKYEYKTATLSRKIAMLTRRNTK